MASQITGTQLSVQRFIQIKNKEYIKDSNYRPFVKGITCNMWIPRIKGREYRNIIVGVLLAKCIGDKAHTLIQT